MRTETDKETEQAHQEFMAGPKPFPQGRSKLFDLISRKIWTPPKKNAVIILKFEGCGYTIE